MLSRSPQHKLDSILFKVTTGIASRSVEDLKLQEKLRALRAELGDDQYFDTLRRHWERNAHHWADAGADTNALMNALFLYCSTYQWKTL